VPVPWQGVWPVWGLFFRYLLKNLSWVVACHPFLCYRGVVGVFASVGGWLTTAWWPTPSAALFNECRLAWVSWFS